MKRAFAVFVRLTDRVPSRIVFLLGIMAFVCALVLHFEFPPSSRSANTAFLGDNELPLLENGTDIEDDSAADDSDDEEDSSPNTAAEAAVEIPECLRPAPLTADPIVISMFDRLGLSETLMPASLQKTLGMSREAILADSDGRIDENFRVPEALKERVGFWFDVYTKYDSNQRIIHHSLFPWIVYKVVDVSAIINSDSPKHLWMRRLKAERIVKAEVLKVRATLHRLSSQKTFDRLTDSERQLAGSLAALGGNPRKQALQALRSVRMQMGQRDFFIEGLRLSSRYLGTMEKIFANHRLPVELTRIPFVESSFNRMATSKVGASGIWQIMDGTGRKFMTIDAVVDERRSPLKATEAAARLLKENHLILHRSWPLAVTAWNHGPSGIRRAAERSGSRDITKIVGHYRSRSFDFASSNFYCEFLAALHAERYSEELFGSIERESQEVVLAVKLTRSMRFRDLLDASGMTLADFLALNPDLTKVARLNLPLAKGFRLHVPDWATEKLDRLVFIVRPRASLASKS